MASKRRIRRKQCTGKQRFETSAEAETAMMRLVRHNKKGGGWLQVYGCSFCNGYHYGHQKRKRT